MNLVYDVYFVFAFCWTVGNLFSDLSDIVYTVVGCSINFDHIHCSSCLDCFAHGTFIAGAAIYGMFTVDCFRQNLCYCCFTGTSGSAEQIGMTNTIMLDLICQGGHNMILSFDICEIIRSEFSVKSSVTHEQSPILLSQPPRKKFPRRSFFAYSCILYEKVSLSQVLFRYQSPKLMPICLAACTSWSFGDTILSLPAHSSRGTRLILPFTTPIIMP